MKSLMHENMFHYRYALNHCVQYRIVSPRPIKKATKRQLLSIAFFYFFEDLLGFNDGVFPGVSLLSRRRLSGSPVDLAIGFGPGLRPIIVIL